MKQRDWRAAPTAASGRDDAMPGDTMGVSVDTAGTPEEAVDTNETIDTTDTELREDTQMDTARDEAPERTPPASAP